MDPTGAPNMGEVFKGRHFDHEIIVLCVRWFPLYRLSFQDLVEMMAIMTRDDAVADCRRSLIARARRRGVRAQSVRNKRTGFSRQACLTWSCYDQGRPALRGSEPAT
jgi:hypothetical protein